MGWVILIFVLAVLMALGYRHAREEQLTEQARREIKETEAAQETLRNVLQDARITLTTGKYADEKAGQEAGYTYEPVDPEKAVRLNGQPAKSLSEDCAACANSFALFWIGPTKPPVAEIFCPFCGTLHQRDDENKTT